MKLNTYNLPFNSISIVPMGDLHIGSAKCKLDDIKEAIERVKASPSTYIVLLGDLINNSTKTSVGDVYSEPMTPMEQMEMAVDLFKPVADKILSVCSGNHERRTYKQDGIDLTAIFCKMLGIEDRYDYVSNLLFISYGKCPVNKNPNCKTIYVTHGDGQGGRLIGSKANGLARRGEVVDADIVITGHTHAPISFKQASYKVDKIHKSVKLAEQTFVNISSALAYEAYAEQVGLPPSSSTTPVIFLTEDGRTQVAV